MATRVQSLLLGLGIGKQTDIATIASTFARFRKLDMGVYTLRFNTETDKDEIGKGHEYITQVFPVSYDVPGRIEKYGSAEFVTWAWAYSLGLVTFGSGTYTIKPIDPTVTLELPYWSMVQQLGEGGGQAIDEAYIGMSIEDVETVITSVPGRASVRTTVNFVGSGHQALPSGVALPAVQSENYMLSQSAAISINGVDYVAAKTPLSVSLGWRNNLLLNAGYFPGAGLINNAAVRGRMEVGNRVPTFVFTARLLHTSTEYASLVAQTTGTAVVTLTFDASHTVTWTYPNVSFEMTERTESDGLTAVTVTVAPRFDSGTNAPLSISAKCAIVGIAQ